MFGYQPEFDIGANETLYGAIRYDEQRRPMHDGEGQAISTLTDLPDTLPSPGEHPTQHFDTPVQVGKQYYLCGGVPHRPGGRLDPYRNRGARWAVYLGAGVALALFVVLSRSA